MAVFANKALELLQDCIEDYYNENDIKYISKLEPKDTIIKFFSWLYRQMPPIPREVVYSQKLLDKIENGDIGPDCKRTLSMFKYRFENGEDMRGFLSTNTLNAEKIDYLRYVWHLYHLHLSDKVALNESEMHSNRSGLQLLAVITQEKVLFVDVIAHPGKGKSNQYFNLNHLRIIRDNGWLKEIGFKEIEGMIPGSLNPKITQTEDIYKLYKTNVNISFEFEGKGYSFVEGISLSGHPFVATETYHRIIRVLRAIEGKYNICKSVKLSSSEEGYLLVVISVASSAGTMYQFDLLSGQKVN